jgi:hypothetical protein
METDACATGEHIRMSFFSAATVWGLFRDGFGPEKFRHGASQCREAIGKLLDQDRSTDADKVLVNILTFWTSSLHGRTNGLRAIWIFWPSSPEAF